MGFLGGHPRSLKSPRFWVEVTKRLMRDAEKRNSSGCMIAEAIKGTRPGGKFVSVDLQTIRFSEAGRRYVYLTPRVVQVALVKFDQGIPGKPFTFQLRNGQSVPSGRNVPKGRAKLVKHGKKSRAVPDKIGGKTPPKMHMVRAFGLRGLEY